MNLHEGWSGFRLYDGVDLYNNKTGCPGKDTLSILYESIVGRYRPVSDSHGPIMARYIFM